LGTEIAHFCRLLYQRGWASGSGGNVSVRAQNGETFLLTPSGYCLGEMEPHDLALVDGRGHLLEGPRPSRETSMHLKIFEGRPDLNAICHVHGAHIVAATSMLDPGTDSLPPLTPAFVQCAYPVPMVPFLVPGTLELAEAVAGQFSNPACRAVLLQNHGLVTAGRSLKEALNLVEEVDETARIYVYSGGKANPIPPEDIDSIA